MTVPASLSVLPLYPSIPVQDGVQQVHSVVQIETTDNKEAQERQGIHICVVLDCSGSMNIENKLDYSKSAIRKIIKRLEPCDTFHLVTYSTNPKIEIEKGDLKEKEKLIAHVNAVTADGGTNIGDAIQLASDLLVKHSMDLKNCVRRMFLFSDGQANEGITSTKGLLQVAVQATAHDVCITSFGIGTDFQEQVMRGIAEKGNGDYFFIGNNNVIPSYVSKSIQCLTNLLGTSARVKVQTSPQIPLKILQFGTIIPQQPETATNIELHIGDLRSNSCKQYLLALEIDTSTLQTGEQPTLACDLVQLELSYLTNKEKFITVQTKLNMNLVTALQNPSESENSLVSVFLLMQQVSKEELNMISLIDSHKYEEASALGKSLINKLTLSLSKDVKGKLQKAIDKLTRMMLDIDSSNTASVQKQLGFHAYQNQQADDHLLSSPCYSPASVEDSFPHYDPSSPQDPDMDMYSGSMHNMMGYQDGGSGSTSPTSPTSPVLFDAMNNK